MSVSLLAGDGEESVLPMRRFFQKVYSQNPIFAAKCGEKAIEEYPMPHVMPRWGELSRIDFSNA